MPMQATVYPYFFRWSIVHGPWTSSPPATIFLQLKSLIYKQRQMFAKTLHLHRFLLEILKRARSSFLIKWF